MGHFTTHNKGNRIKKVYTYKHKKNRLKQELPYNLEIKRSKNSFLFNLWLIIATLIGFFFLLINNL